MYHAARRPATSRFRPVCAIIGEEKFERYNRFEYTLPHLVEGGFGAVREGLYQGFFAGEDAVEMHNEPNLRFFWHGTEEQYAEACLEGARILKSVAPAAHVAVGSASHLW
jgi:hypothetical protein